MATHPILLLIPTVVACALLVLGIERLIRSRASEITRTSEVWAGMWCFVGGLFISARLGERLGQGTLFGDLAARLQLALSFGLGITTMLLVEVWISGRTEPITKALALAGVLLALLLAALHDPSGGVGVMVLMQGAWLCALGSYLLLRLKDAPRYPWSLRSLVMGFGFALLIASVSDIALSSLALRGLHAMELSILCCGLAVVVLSERRARWQIEQAEAGASKLAIENATAPNSSAPAPQARLASALEVELAEPSSGAPAYPPATELMRAASRIAKARRRLPEGEQADILKGVEASCLEALRALSRTPAGPIRHLAEPLPPERPPSVPPAAMDPNTQKPSIATIRGATDDPNSEPAARTLRQSGTTLRKIRVLVVDDESAIVSLVRRALAKHEVVGAASVHAAIELLADGSFDLILCDLTLEDGSGQEVFQRAAAFGAHQQERFVFMTGGAYTPQSQAFLDETGLPVLEKPVTLKMLRDLAAARAALPVAG